MKKIELNREQNLIQDSQNIPLNNKPYSHLTKILEKRTKRNFLIILFGIFFFGILLVFFGPKMLIQYSLLLEKNKDQIRKNESRETLYSPPPTIISRNTATNSALFELSGTAENAEKIRIYLNSEIISTVIPNSDQSFGSTFSLKKGENIIKVKAISPSRKESPFSNTLTVLYDDTLPSLIILKPNDGETFEKTDSPILIAGKTEPDAILTINSLQAIVDNQGNFEYSLPLKDGDNEIKIITRNKFGNKTEKKINIHYSL